MRSGRNCPRISARAIPTIGYGQPPKPYLSWIDGSSFASFSARVHFLRHFSPFSIRVNVSSPSPTTTTMIQRRGRQLVSFHLARDRIFSRIRRPLIPEELLPLLFFLPPPCTTPCSAGEKFRQFSRQRLSASRNATEMHRRVLSAPRSSNFHSAFFGFTT